MTVITGPLGAIGPAPLDGTLTARVARYRSGDGTLLVPRVDSFPIAKGVVEAALAPGPAVLTIEAGDGTKRSFDVVIPKDGPVSVADLVEATYSWTPEQVSVFERLRDETVAAAAEVREIVDGYTGGEGGSDAALLSGVLTDLVDVSAGLVTVDGDTRSVAEIASEVDQKAHVGHGHPMGHIGGLADALAAKADVGHVHDWDSVAGKPVAFPATAHTHPKSEVDGLDTALAAKADLDGSGRLPASQLPALAIVEFLGEVDGEAAMLTLSGERGDWCVRQDTGTQWVVVAEPSTSASSWREMVAPPSPVQSVAGRIGAVVLSKADVGLAQVDNTADADKPVSTATAAALEGKADVGHTHTAAQVGAIASDGTITKAVRITQAAYDALPVRDPFTLYVIGGA